MCIGPQCNFHRNQNRNRNQISMNTFSLLHTSHLNIGIGKKIGRSVGTGRQKHWKNFPFYLFIKFLSFFLAAEVV